MDSIKRLINNRTQDIGISVGFVLRYINVTTKTELKKNTNINIHCTVIPVFQMCYIIQFTLAMHIFKFPFVAI